MSDVTRWTIVPNRETGWRRVGDKDGDLILHTDHLAALERVRVETLRELTEVVDIRIRREYGVVDGDNDFSRGLYRATQILREERNKAIRHPLRADATTTGDTNA